jgi:farnesyl diphosphate synthase
VLWGVCQVGLSAINDGVLLKCHVQAIIKRYFKEKFYFVDLMELWNEVTIISLEDIHG